MLVFWKIAYVLNGWPITLLKWQTDNSPKEANINPDFGQSSKVKK